MSGQQLVDGFKATSGGREPGFIVGMLHALFEVAIDVLKRADSVEKPEGILKAIADTNYNSIIGPVDWKSAKGPVKNVSRTPIVAGQWERPVPGQPLRFAIKANAGHPNIPVDGTLKLL